MAFGLAIFVLATQTCRADMASVDLEIDPGAATAALSRANLAVLRGDETEPVAVAELNPGAPLPLRWTLQLDPGSYRLDVRALLSDGSSVRFERRFEASDGAQVRFDLSRELSRD